MSFENTQTPESLENSNINQSLDWLADYTLEEVSMRELLSWIDWKQTFVLTQLLENTLQQNEESAAILRSWLEK